MSAEPAAAAASATAPKRRPPFKKDKPPPGRLPIDDFSRTILYQLELSQVLLVVAETGSGKSTRLPQILYSAGIYNEPTDKSNPSNDKPENKNRVICVTQPRRIAAMQLAQRVAEELKCELGTTVGYSVRFLDQTDEQQTRIKFLTEGLLLREMMHDPQLSRISVIIVDEVHERNLNTDLLLGLLKCLLLKRRDLKLVICSATLNIDQILKFFTYKSSDLQLPKAAEMSGDELFEVKPEVLCIPSKLFPVKVYYREQPTPNYLEASVETVININESSLLEAGKILVFLTGQDEVDYACERLNEYAEANCSRLDIQSLMALPLHASLKPEEISRVFDEYGRNTRLCVVATNVAETSLTINDVAFVVDCGFVKMKIYDNRKGMDSLMRVPISKSSAQQRAGRAGRTRAGNIYRLYSEAEFDRLPEQTVPEIQRSSLTEVIMLMMSLGIRNVQRFPLVAPMPRDNLTSAMEHLYALQLIDTAGQLTAIGEKAALLSLDPRLARILVGPEASFCNLEACRVVAMLQVKEIYFKTGRHASDIWRNASLTSICASEGDLLSYLNIMNAFLANNKNQKWAEKRNLNYQALLNAAEISERLEAQLKWKCNIDLKSCDGRIELIRRSLLAGLFANAALLQSNGDYKTIRGEQTVYVHPTSVYSEILDKPKHVVYVEILETSKTYMRHMMAIEPDWLLEVAPHFYTFATGL